MFALGERDGKTYGGCEVGVGFRGAMSGSASLCLAECLLQHSHNHITSASARMEELRRNFHSTLLLNKAILDVRTNLVLKAIARAESQPSRILGLALDVYIGLQIAIYMLPQV
jgi:hypothetical protein